MLLVRHDTQDFSIGIGIGCWLMEATSALLPQQPKYHLFYLRNNQIGQISNSDSGFWEDTSSDVHSTLLRSFVSQERSTMEVFT